jgi:hypothetical protein
MNNLVELKNFLESKEIRVKSYNGWQLVIGNDTWGMINDVYYCNSEPVPKKEILNRAQQSIEKDTSNVKPPNNKPRKKMIMSAKIFS